MSPCTILNIKELSHEQFVRRTLQAGKKPHRTKRFLLHSTNIHSRTLSKHRHSKIPCSIQSPLFQHKNHNLCAEKLLGKRWGLWVGATLCTRPRQQWLSAIIQSVIDDHAMRCHLQLQTQRRDENLTLNCTD